MNSIKFTHLWDKLNDPEFTTIRPWNLAKQVYYASHMGEKFQIWKAQDRYPFRREHVICHAYLYEVIAVDPKAIPETLLTKDVTLNGSIDQSWYRRIRRMDKVLILKFSKYPRPLQKRLELVE